MKYTDTILRRAWWWQPAGDLPRHGAASGQRPVQVPGRAVLDRVGLATLTLLDALADWQKRGRERRQLASLTDLQLKDAGLSRADVVAELAKPFWRR